MRIRILSEFEQTNLPGIRSWFNVDKENTVTSLKLSLCASVPVLRDAHVRAEELVLALDDFELLDDSPIHILRDGDLIWYAEHMYSIFCHLNNGFNSLRRRTHLPKRKAKLIEDTPRKRRQLLPDAKGAAGSYAAVGGVGINGFVFQAPGHYGRGRSTQSSSSSSSSDTSSDTSSDDTSSNSESTSGSTSDSDSDSDSDSNSNSNSTSSSSSDNLVRRVPRPAPSFEHQRKPSQPRYVTSTLSRIYLSAVFVPQAYSGTTWVWKATDP